MTTDGPRYTLHQLAVFVAVGETGSVSAAAARLHLSASAVSASITDLERTLGVQLCVRRRAKGVHLTPTGEDVLLRARTVLQDAAVLEHTARGQVGVVGPVRVGCYPSLGPTVLPALVEGFAREHPAAYVQVHEADQDTLRFHLDRGELDLAIVYDLDLPATWEIEVLHRRSPSIILRADHPIALAHVDGIDPVDLAEQPLVLRDAPPSSFHAFRVCTLAGFTPRVAYRSANSSPCGPSSAGGWGGPSSSSGRPWTARTPATDWPSCPSGDPSSRTWECASPTAQGASRADPHGPSPPSRAVSWAGLHPGQRHCEEQPQKLTGKCRLSAVGQPTRLEGPAQRRVRKAFSS